MHTVHGAERTTIIVLGRTSDITNGFASGVEREGWRWEEVPDILMLSARPLPPRAVIAVPIPVLTPTACAMIRHLTTTLALPVVVFSTECHPAVVDAALRAGADEFLLLPVTIEEMVARLTAVIRVRLGVQGEPRRSDFQLDETAHTVSIAGGTTIRLSASECRLLRTLLAARNRPVARERLAIIPLPQSDPDDQHTLDAIVSRLRRKLGAGRIITIRGIGYQLVDHQQPPDNLTYLHAARIARNSASDTKQ